MSISFGGLGIMSLRRPFAELAGTVLGKGDIQSVFCIVVFCIVFLVLAYLTNPSETSFRAYLTELSFRQHLRRLDTIDDDERDILQDGPSNHVSFRHGTTKAHTTLPFENRSPFHFANRASVSLRTPKHVFHSFGIFTIAAIIPAAKSDRSSDDHRDVSMLSDSWFIGAFGRWWRGGVLEAWYQDVIARSGNVEESWSSGILGMKTLDRMSDCNALPGLPFSTKNLPPHGLSRGSPPRLRNREKSSQRSGLMHSRSSTPPPLPKGASLPLHTPRSSPSSIERNTTQAPASTASPAQPAASVVEEQPKITPPGVLPQPNSFEQSPRVVELVHQISLSNTAILDLRNQLTDYQTAANQSHAQLQQELDSCREKKKQEDTARNDLKLRTKALDDSKRIAESTKRDAEKRLRAAESARDDALRRMEHLDKEISALQQRLEDDANSIRNTRGTISEEEHEVEEAIDRKKREIQIAEDVVAALNTRARDLEDKLNQKVERLRLMREQAEARKKENSFSGEHTSTIDSSGHLWSPDVAQHSPTMPSRPPSDPIQPMHTDFLPNNDALLDRTRRLSDPRDRQTSTRPPKLLLGGLSSASAEPLTSQRGYFDHPLVPFGNRSQQLGSFSPFGDMDGLSQTPAVVLSPSTSSALIPSGLISSLDNIDGVSRSFQSDSDVFLERGWRNLSDENLAQQPEPITNAPISLSPTADDSERDPFEIRIYAPQDRYTKSQRNTDGGIYPHRNDSDPSSSGYEIESVQEEKTGPKRWFSLRDKPKNGLNPDAKAFDLFRKSQRPAPPVPNPTVYDALNPTGLGSALLASTTSDNSTLLRAFAPSPAEREALHRALGGSTNASLERLPSLSDVGGSIPPSPNHVHAQAVAHPQRDLGKIPVLAPVPATHTQTKL